LYDQIIDDNIARLASQYLDDEKQCFIDEHAKGVYIVFSTVLISLFGFCVWKHFPGRERENGEKEGEEGTEEMDTASSLTTSLLNPNDTTA